MIQSASEYSAASFALKGSTASSMAYRNVSANASRSARNAVYFLSCCSLFSLSSFCI